MTAMKRGWLLYDSGDYEVNRAFAEHMREIGKRVNLAMEVVLTDTLRKPLTALPDFIVSRQRNHRLSAEFEAAGVPVFNCARVCEICNDKRNTHRFLDGLPLIRSLFAEPGGEYRPSPQAYPLVVKPAAGHGGDRVSLAENQAQLECALQSIWPSPAIIQEAASEAGRDLRLYVVFGEIKAAVLRTATVGIVSNYKRGGSVLLHTPTDAETALAQRVIRRFAENGAPLSFAGIDLIYHRGEPVVNEVEDVVGSRMLYKVSDIDIADLYLRGIAARLS